MKKQSKLTAEEPEIFDDLNLAMGK